MRKLCAFVFLVVTLQYCISCQKELSYELPAGTQRSQGDSLVLVKTIQDLEFDSSDQFLSQEWQTFTYDTVLNHTVVAIADSDIYNPGQVINYTSMFQYDASGRLVKFSTTGGHEPVAEMDMMYGSDGNLSSLSMNNNWVGKTFDLQFKTTTQSGQKVVTVYDTSGAHGPADTRPEISNYAFDAKNRLVSETIYYSQFSTRKNWLEDTSEIQYSYDNNNFIPEQLSKDTYHFSPDDSSTVTDKDSSLYTGEGNNTALLNSFLYVYKNMYWLNISEFSSGFANALNKGDLETHCGAAVKTAEFWTFSPPDPSVIDYEKGIIQNTFDAAGLLVKCVYPKKFGNKYGGRSEGHYTYTKIKK